MPQDALPPATGAAHPSLLDEALAAVGAVDAEIERASALAEQNLGAVRARAERLQRLVRRLQ